MERDRHDSADLARIGSDIQRRLVRDRVLVELRDKPRVPPLLDAEAARDLKEPRRERSLPAEARQMPKRHDQRLLQHLARGLLISAHPQPEAVDRTLVLGKQRLQGSPITLLRNA